MSACHSHPDDVWPYDHLFGITSPCSQPELDHESMSGGCDDASHASSPSCGDMPAEAIPGALEGTAPSTTCNAQPDTLAGEPAKAPFEPELVKGAAGNPMLDESSFNLRKHPRTKFTVFLRAKGPVGPTVRLQRSIALCMSLVPVLLRNRCSHACAYYP